jgi:hypothetical protein
MNTKQNIEHCCSKMDFLLKEQKVAIGYNRRFREYYINLRNVDAIQLINFCPWCGSRLPESLGDVLCSELIELGLEPFDSDISDKYKTDEWRKDREL